MSSARVGKQRGVAARSTLGRAGKTAKPPAVEPQSFVFDTALGWMALTLRESGVERLVFGHDTPAEALAACGAAGVASARPTGVAAEIVRSLKRFARGEAIALDAVRLAPTAFTPFQQKVYARCRKIARGQTMSYAELAAAVGSPGAARAVGTCMAKNRVPLIVPCHRVVGAGGSLGGYSAQGGLKTKSRLLAMEKLDQR